MKRAAYQDLITWKNNPSRKPLLVQGARQVGKTWLIKEFSCNEYDSYAYFNFEETPALTSLFEGDLNPRHVLETLSAYQGQTIVPLKTLLFFDEIQACPRALTSLKYFCEQAPEIHIVAAGSLLGVSVGKTTGFPVGKVNFLTLFPLSFLEFLEALGEKSLLALLREKKDFAPIAELLHEKLSGLLRTFLFTGGMPEVVQCYRQTRDFTAVRAIQKEILHSYQRDFSKYTTATQAVRVSEIWRSIPSHLARENKKFKYGDVRKGGRAIQFESAVEWLRSAGLMYTSTNVTAARLPLAGYEDHARFKAYMLDCGLLGAIIDVPARIITLGDASFSEYNGAFVENFAATELARKTEGMLHYWISEGIAEVDFLVTHNEEILPLEVKSGLNRAIKSLRVYADKFKPSRVYRVSPRNFECHDNFVNIPLYALLSAEVLPHEII
jgi:predicted AAA+ superfamily ATPase